MTLPDFSAGPAASTLSLGDGAGGLLAHAAVPFMTRSSTPCSSISVAGVVVEDAAVGDDEHAVGEAEHLLDLARHHDDRGAGVGEPTDEGVDLGAGADVDTAGGLVEQQHAGAVHEPAGQHDLLLVAARERAGGAVGIGRPQLERLDLLAGHRALAALVEHRSHARTARRSRGSRS